jgi:hypothetical protein
VERDWEAMMQKRAKNDSDTGREIRYTENLKNGIPLTLVPVLKS